jgi:hypothetical protein
VPLKALSAADIIGGVFASLRYAAGPLIAIGLAVGVAQGVIQVLTEVISYPSAPFGSWSGDLDRLPNLAGRAVSVFALMPIGVLVTLAGFGLAAVAVSRGVLGRRTTLAQCVAAVRGRMGTVLGMAGVVAAIALGCGIVATLVITPLTTVPRPSGAAGTLAALVAVLLVLLGIALAMLALSARLMPAMPTVVLEGATVREGLRRAWALSRGATWRFIGVNLLGGLIGVAFTLAACVPLVLLAVIVPTQVAAVGITFLTAAVVTTITLPISASVATLLYIDQRFRRENLAPVLWRAAQEPETWDV